MVGEYRPAGVDGPGSLGAISVLTVTRTARHCAGVASFRLVGRSSSGRAGGRRMSGRRETAALVADLRAGLDLSRALSVFDGQDPVPVEGMLGTWRGSEVPTGHPLDGILGPLGWYGKRFDGPDDVHPLVMTCADGALWSLDPAVVPIGLLVRRPAIAHLPGVGRVLRLARPLVGTRRPAARVRMTEYRGVTSATMCYDALPVHDVFRRIDEQTVLGVMDLRGAPPYVFLLERAASPGS
jgi:hypothetical protein